MRIYQFSAPELIELLGSYGVTQREIARRTGFHFASVNRIALGAQRPREEFVDALIEMLRQKAEMIKGLRDDLIAMIDQAEAEE